MMNRELSRQQQRLDSLFKRIKDATGDDVEMQSHWAKYLCVLCAGFIENAIKEIYGDFVKGAASTPVANYSIKTLSRIQNPQTTKFIETARAFKSNWADELEAFVAEDGRKDATDSIMSNRHNIAHGKDSGVSIVRMKEWYKKSVEVLEYLETQCRT
jgi:hypothetical protein